MKEEMNELMEVLGKEQFNLMYCALRDLTSEGLEEYLVQNFEKWGYHEAGIAVEGLKRLKILMEQAD